VVLHALPEYVSSIFDILSVSDTMIIVSQSRESGNIGYTRLRKTKQKHNTISIGHHYAQANTNNVSNVCGLLQITGDII
jgi:hypothetical protein